MESHPIPQQISSYQFRLVGDMTLKQFFQLGGGALVAAIFFASGLPPLIKWPLALFSVSTGAALAFLPFEERPLSHWIISFFTSIYSPTIFVWQSKGSYDFFLEETQSSISTNTQIPPETSHKEEKTGENKLEELEENFLANLKNMFNSIPTQVNIPTEKVSSGKTQLEKTDEKKEVEIPQVTIPTFSRPSEPKTFRPKIIIEQSPAEPQNQKATVVLQNVSPVFKEKQENVQAAQFSPQAAPPLPPTTPNTITGQVLDEKGKIVEGAILEIRDSSGKPVRALRSNKLGHFMIVTPLQNGQYDIVTEKEGYEFKPVVFEAKGKIIPPILIRGRSLLPN